MPLHFFDEKASEVKHIAEQAKDCADSLLRPTAIEDDTQCHFRKEIFQALADKQLTSISLPKEFGGLGLSSTVFFAAIEELAKASPSMAIVVGVTNLIQGGISQFGSIHQKEKYLTKLVSGEWLGAFSLSESGSGSDAAGLKLQAKKSKGGYILNGSKLWCSNAGYADLYLVMARTSEDKTKGITSFLVSSDMPGFKVGKQEKKLGLRASSLAELVFENCFVPDERRLGDEGQGIQIALSQLDAGRISIGTVGAGITAEVIERAWNSIAEEGIKQEFSTYYAGLQALKSLIMLTAKEKDRGTVISVLSSQVKLLGSELAMASSSYAMTAMGYEGALREKEVERYFRDSKALQIVEGTNQIQRLVLMRALNAQLS